MLARGIFSERGLKSAIDSAVRLGKVRPWPWTQFDGWDDTVFLMFLILREKCQTMRGRNLYASSGGNLVLEVAVEEAGGIVFRWRFFVGKKMDFPHKYVSGYIRIFGGPSGRKKQTLVEI